MTLAEKKLVQYRSQVIAHQLDNASRSPLALSVQLFGLSLLEMRDERKDDQHEPRQPAMPYISIPTETVRIHEGLPIEQTPSATTASPIGTSGFLLGIDTCGFTTSSTITCDFGYECTDVGTHRGCCLPGDYDCISTIYTDCIDYGNAPDAGACGSHTLCCSDTKPYCFTYAFSTDKDPGATFTYVECNPTNGFGEMYPFPPELMTMTSATDTSSSTTSGLPTPSPTSSNYSTGGIIGGVVGGVGFILIVVVIVVLSIRYRNHRRQAAIKAAGISAPIQTPHSSTDISPTTEKEQARAVAAATAAAKNDRVNRRSFLRPLSLIREHPIPITITPAPDADSPSSPARYKHKSAAAAPARQTFGPNWPLGPEPGSNPLGAHPIDAQLKKRLSDSRLVARGMALTTNERPPRVPRLYLPPPGTRRPPHSSGGTPTSAEAALQSPRLDWVPVSPILGVAFGDVNGDGSSVSRVIDGLGQDGDSAGATTVVGTEATDTEPVSPMESEEEEEGEGERGVGEDMQRLSCLSAPSGYSVGDDLVSPLSPREQENEGEGEDATVSPLDSRRGSVGS
ncbi:hypothetical protein F5Y13DRAFT_197342 [Hypoxylon sp. FL1857]|nr:hypothetical protein F5Y13DRAFT_197342 [Hypoxylon sp. FL1857]